MGKKRIIIIISAIIILIVAWFVMSVFFGIGPSFPGFRREAYPAMGSMDEGNMNKMYAENQVLALLDTEEEASEMAEKYGMELMLYNSGVATFHTDEDPEELVKQINADGYEDVYINYVRKAN